MPHFYSFFSFISRFYQMAVIIFLNDIHLIHPLTCFFVADTQFTIETNPGGVFGYF